MLCVLVILSRAYPRSEYCMSEFHRLYTNARQRDKDFLRRILLLPLIQDHTRIATPYEHILLRYHPSLPKTTAPWSKS